MKVAEFSTSEVRSSSEVFGQNPALLYDNNRTADVNNDAQADIFE
ncbi:hypothetical protein QUF64_16155 [Anaerolineales bacterium HSG6]|nr:hypothetical protein [Anaerolineales bacterium HSG6]